MILTDEIRHHIRNNLDKLKKETPIHVVTLEMYASTDPVWQKKNMKKVHWEAIYPRIEKDLPDYVLLYPKNKLIRYARCWQKHLEDNTMSPKQWWGGSHG